MELALVYGFLSQKHRKANTQNSLLGEAREIDRNEVIRQCEKKYCSSSCKTNSNCSIDHF